MTGSFPNMGNSNCYGFSLQADQYQESRYVHRCPKKNCEIENKQTNEYGHHYKKGEYASKPFVNYYKRDLMKAKQKNKSLNNNSEKVDNDLSEKVPKSNNNSNDDFEQKEIIFPYPDQNQNNYINPYKHKCTLGSYLSKPYVNDYRKDLTKPNQMNENNTNQNNINNINNNNSENVVQNPFNTMNNNIKNEIKIHFPEQNQMQNNYYRANNYNHPFIPGSYSSRPPVNYYRNDLMQNRSDDQYNLYNSNQNITEQTNNQQNSYVQQSLAIPDAPVQRINTENEYNNKAFDEFYNQQILNENQNQQFYQGNQNQQPFNGNQNQQPFNGNQNQQVFNGNQDQVFNENQQQQYVQNPYKTNNYQRNQSIQQTTNSVEIKENENKTEKVFPYPKQSQKQENKQGKYSSKPFVNYYKKDLVKVKQNNENTQKHTQQDQNNENDNSSSNHYKLSI